MRKKTNFLIYLLILMGVFFVFEARCQNEDNANMSNFTDPRDGKIYQTIRIGRQVWMAENLAYIPSVVGPKTGSVTEPYYYVYDYYGKDVSKAKARINYTTYGVLYNWTAAINACPTGWHLPSDTEWEILINYLGGESVAGGKLKETVKKHWSSRIGANNESGFSALPGGYRDGDGILFDNIGNNGYWWSSTEYNKYVAWNRGMRYYDSNVKRAAYNKEMSISVRCLKN